MNNKEKEIIIKYLKIIISECTTNEKYGTKEDLKESTGRLQAIKFLMEKLKVDPGNLNEYIDYYMKKYKGL